MTTECDMLLTAQVTSLVIAAAICMGAVVLLAEFVKKLQLVSKPLRTHYRILQLHVPIVLNILCKNSVRKMLTWYAGLIPILFQSHRPLFMECSCCYSMSCCSYAIRRNSRVEPSLGFQA